MDNEFTLTLQHDSWLDRVIIGFRLSFNQDKLIGAFSDVQLINEISKCTDIHSNQTINDINEISGRVINVFEELIDG